MPLLLAYPLMVTFCIPLPPAARNPCRQGAEGLMLAASVSILSGTREIERLAPDGRLFVHDDLHLLKECPNVCVRLPRQEYCLINKQRISMGEWKMLYHGWQQLHYIASPLLCQILHRFELDTYLHQAHTWINYRLYFL